MDLVDFIKERAKEFGNKTFLWEKKNSLTFKEFDQVTDRLAAGLQYLGVKKGDHAAVLFPNSVDTLLSYVSVIKAGGTAIPINPLYTPREIEEVLYTHPAVYEAAVIGVPDEVKGEIPKAFITLKSGQKTSEREMVDFY